MVSQPQDEATGTENILLSLAENFAEDVRATIADTVHSDVEPFEVTATPSSTSPNEAFAVIQSNPSPNISLKSDTGDSVFDLSLEYRVFLGEFLTVENSKFEVGLRKHDAPLFRYEYVRRPKSNSIPSAHMHVHAHRDQFIHGMMLSNRGRSKSRQKDLDKTGKVPYLSDVHFPLGGPRLRPSIEDLLEMLIHEFGVQAQPRALERLAASREKWRLIQLYALVRRNITDVIDVLDEEGYDVSARPGVIARDGLDPALRLY